MELELWLSLVALFFTGGLTPGPAVMLVLASSFRYGFKPALLPALGVASANVVWLVLAASGTAALFEIYPRATLALKILGILVLGWMALSVMFGPLPRLEPDPEDAPKRGQLYAKGVLLQNHLAHASRLFRHVATYVFSNGGTARAAIFDDVSHRHNFGVIWPVSICLCSAIYSAIFTESKNGTHFQHSYRRYYDFIRSICCAFHIIALVKTGCGAIRPANIKG